MTYPAVSPKLPIQAIGAKIFHYCNFISLLIMLTSGLQIYNANPVLVAVVAYVFFLCLP